mgnify:CR=1 FL=1
MGQLFFLGDSITAGSTDPGGGWAARLSARIMNENARSHMREDHFFCFPYNLGVAGDTTKDLAKRAESEIEARRKFDPELEAIDIICSIGINDAHLSSKDNRPLTSVNQFRDDYETLVTVLERTGGRILLTGLLPVDESRTNPFPWISELSSRNEHIAELEAVIKAIADEKRLDFLPLFEDFSALTDYEQYLLDGLHPDEQGHKLLADKIGKFVFTDFFFDRHKVMSDCDSQNKHNGPSGNTGPHT